MIARRAIQAGALGVALIVALALAGCTTSSSHTVHTATTVRAEKATPATIIHVNGIDRRVVIHDPARPSGSLVPALILLHGASASSSRMEAASGMTQVAAADGFLVAYGEGTPTGRPVGGGAWNAGRCCAAAVTTNMDDIAYLGAVIDELVADHHVDPARVYLGGFSNGAMMTYRAACEIGNRLAGIVVVSGALNVDSCAAPKALPVLVIHGKKDRTVPYNGGRPNRRTAAKLGSWVNSPVSKGVDFWSTRDDCTGRSKIDSTKVLTDVRYTGCTAGDGVEVVSIANGTHRWPTKTNEDFDASAYIVCWFGLSKLNG